MKTQCKKCLAHHSQGAAHSCPQWLVMLVKMGKAKEIQSVNDLKEFLETFSGNTTVERDAFERIAEVAGIKLTPEHTEYTINGFTFKRVNKIEVKDYDKNNS